MNHINIIINPRFSKHSLVNIVGKSPEKMCADLNFKYSDSNIENDFYRIVYSKKINGDISLISSKLENLLSKYKSPKSSSFYEIEGSLAIEIIENEFFKNMLSDSDLINWWSSLNIGWKYTFKKRIHKQFELNESEANLCKISIKELREILLIDRLSIWREEIKFLEPLKFLRQLKQINCSISEISDLEPLSELYNLEELNIVDTKVESLKAISNLLNLKKIYCFRTKVTSINHIAHFRKLEIIYIDNCIPIDEIKLITKHNPNCKINYT
ncbi:hypothetical protein [uncultured Tenacibaculum sp.]|uniref:hypothetical protein n=1 Tax=uncultured Tenacibaculum sp. TaxID=174713 RepID=UPI00261ADE80|nr:hypothetical protein [uncultured Tenacibaculum sp.]